MSPNRSIRYVPEAADELKNTAFWYEEQKAGLGSAFMLSVEAIMSKVRRDPEMFPIVYENTRRALIKRFPYGVFYQIEEEVVILVRGCNLNNLPIPKLL